MHKPLFEAKGMGRGVFKNTTPSCIAALLDISPGEFFEKTIGLLFYKNQQKGDEEIYMGNDWFYEYFINELKAIRRNCVPKLQPDWNQNDDTKSDYVKNRTHYEESTYTDYALSMCDTTIVGFSMPEVGETITVKINGVESAETVKEAESNILGGSYKYIGNVDFDSLPTGGTGWFVGEAQGYIVGLANPDTTISLECIVVHKINDKFINYDGFARTFDYYFKDFTLYKTLYDDTGNECLLYKCSYFILPDGDLQLIGFVGEIGFSKVGSRSPHSCFVTAAIINNNGSITLKSVVLGTDIDEMKKLAADCGYTHTTKPNV